MRPRTPIVALLIASMLSASAAAFAQAPPAAPPAPATPAPYPAAPAPYPAAPAPYPVAPAPYPPPAPYPYPAPYHYPAPQGPRYIKDWEPGMPIPPGYRAEPRARRGLVIAGAIVFGGLYLYSVLIGEEENNSSVTTQSNTSWLWIPLAGPLLQMTEGESNDIPRSVLFLDFLGQAAGLTMFIAGLALPRPMLVRNDVVSMTVVPMMVGKDASGLGFVGRF